MYVRPLHRGILVGRKRSGQQTQIMRQTHGTAAVSLSIFVQCAVSQSITIDWTMDASGLTTPHLRGIEKSTDGGAYNSDANVLPEKSLSEEDYSDLYEASWWRDGFGEDTHETWFAASPIPRGRRPEIMVKLGHRVGVVYEHTQTGALGVIVGWDARTRAPREWLSTALPGHRSWAERLRRLHAPHYSVLEQLRNADGSMHFQQRYIVAHCTENGADGPSCLRLFEEGSIPQLKHPDLKRYFHAFSASVGYVPHPAWDKRYPHG